MAGVELRYGLGIGLDGSFQDMILTKVRKRLSQQNSTKKVHKFEEKDPGLTKKC